MNATTNTDIAIGDCDVDRAAPTSSSTPAAAIRLVVLVLAFVVLYLLTVRTRTEQRLEDVGMLEAVAHPHLGLNDTPILSSINAWTLSLVLVPIALANRRWGSLRRARGVTAFVALSVVASEVLKRLIIPRPNLLHVLPWLTTPSFPSGHTTVALTVSIAILMAVPPRCRPIAAVVTSVYAVGVAVTTLTSASHRLGDVIGSCILVALTSDVLIRWLNPVHRPRRSISRSSRPLTLVLAGIGGLVVGESVMLVTQTAAWPPTAALGTTTLLVESVIAAACVAATLARALRQLGDDEDVG